MSMKNKDTWNFAHKYCGKLWLILGLILLPLTFIVMRLVTEQPTHIVAIVGGAVCALQLIIMVCSVIPTEMAIKKIFDSYGFRR